MGALRRRPPRVGWHIRPPRPRRKRRAGSGARRVARSERSSRSVPSVVPPLDALASARSKDILAGRDGGIAWRDYPMPGSISRSRCPRSQAQTISDVTVATSFPYAKKREPSAVSTGRWMCRRTRRCRLVTAGDAALIRRRRTILSPDLAPRYSPTAMPSARGSEPPARMPVSGSRAITCTEPPAPHIPARVIG